MLFIHPFVTGLLAQNINKRFIFPSPWFLTVQVLTKKKDKNSRIDVSHNFSEFNY